MWITGWKVAARRIGADRTLLILHTLADWVGNGCCLVLCVIDPLIHWRMKRSLHSPLWTYIQQPRSPADRVVLMRGESFDKFPTDERQFRGSVYRIKRLRGNAAWRAAWQSSRRVSDQRPLATHHFWPTAVVTPVRRRSSMKRCINMYAWRHEVAGGAIFFYISQASALVSLHVWSVYRCR